MARTLSPWLFVLLLALPASAASPRFARLGAFEGPVEVQLDSADLWRPASVNLPLTEGTRIRTGSGALLEIELDDTSAFRMAGEGLAELSDYSRLSGGQRITVISLDHGLAYFTGEPGDGSAIHLLVPGAQATLRQGSRVRLRALPDSSDIAILEGAARFTIPSADMELHQGQTARVTVPASTQFSLFREVAVLEPDAWNEQLDKAEAQAPASRLDLDHAGKWIRTGEYGTIWQPTSQAGWAPFREGRWLWFQSVGFTWAASEPWGWKPYHEGRWLQHPSLGWVWLPDAQANPDFCPGAVYWARSTTLVAWGPLAPDELWTGAGPPRQFAARNSTSAQFSSGVREIVPSPVEDMPKDLLKVFQFTAALPSPPLPVSRLTIPRDPLRTRLFSAIQVEPAVTRVPEPPPPPAPETITETAPPPGMAEPAPANTYAPDPAPSDANVVNVPGIIILTQPGHGQPGKAAATKTPVATTASTKTSAPAPKAVTAPPITRNAPEPLKPGPHTTRSTSSKVLPLRGAGSTLAAPLYQAWFEFTPSGSGAGIRQLMDRQIDLAATDLPLTDEQLRPMGTRPLHFPVAVTAVVPIYNISGVSGELHLTGEALAGIYLGMIRYWDDPRIAAANSRYRLPHADIVPVHRAGGSATTYIWTDYLGKVSPEWKNAHGVGGTANWSVGLAGKGDEGVAQLVRQTPNSIGYVEMNFAANNHLPIASVRNRAGRYVQASPSALSSAADFATRNLPSDFRGSIADAAGMLSYPISSLTWLLVPSRIEDSSKREAMQQMLTWMLGGGQDQAAGVGLTRLPANLIARETQQLALLQ